MVINLAGLERTPVSGRWRTVWLNEEEEKTMVREVLNSCDVKTVKESDGKKLIKRDWLKVLKVILGESMEQSYGEMSLLGSKVLDPREDWRVGWVENVLRVLEQGGVSELVQDGKAISNGQGSRPPKFRYELRGRHDGAKVRLREGYDVMVLERDEGT
jgi:hypothetical protein